MTDPIADTDLIAFVDGQLDVMRRLDVEAYLAGQPDVAARVMAEMHDRDALRESFAPSPGPGPDRLRLAARRLDRSLRWSSFASRLKRAAAIAVLVGAGWLAHSEVGQFGVPDTFASPVDPALVADAQQAREVARLRARIGAQGAPAYDRDRLSAATGIALPALPEGWTVRDVQVFPARSGTGIEVAFSAGDLGEVSLFATRRRSAGLVQAAGPATDVEDAGDGATLAWTTGGSAYAVSGGHDAKDLRHAALALAAAP